MNHSIKQSKERIGLSIDESEPLPDWLSERISEDSSLREFHEAAQRLAVELRRDADSWVSDHQSERRNTKVSLTPTAFFHRVSSRAITTVAAVALALAAVSWYAHKMWNEGERRLVKVDPKNSKTPLQKNFYAEALSDERLSSDADASQSSYGDGVQFEKYFYVTVESSFRTLQSVGEILSETAVNQPFQRTIQAHETEGDLQSVLETEPATLTADSRQHSQHHKQIQLIRELMETTDFLVETLPREATQSWMDLSVASNSSQ